ncbi:MAG: hypothetical protein ACFFD4_19995 [Candidatus Odinarchaeota archaeon]
MTVAKVSTEQEQFEVEFAIWQQLIERNASLQERVKTAQMEDYIKRAQPLLKMEMPRES